MVLQGYNVKVLQESLQPQQSLSRIGRLSSGAMGGIVRQSVGLFAAPPASTKDKERNDALELMVMSQIMRPAQPSASTEEEWRALELISSPREDPGLDEKLHIVKEQAKQSRYDKTMEREKHGDPQEAPPLMTTQVLFDMLERTRPLDPELSDRDTLESPGKGFTMAKRFQVRNSTHPSVGHYYPKFDVIQRKTCSHPFSGTPKSRSQSALGSPSSRHSVGHEASPSRSQRQRKNIVITPVEEWTPMTAEKSAIWPDIPSEAERPQTSPTMPPTGSPTITPTQETYKKRASDKKRGTSSFVSKTKVGPDRKPDPPRSPDKSYWPYNEASISQRTKGSVDFSKRSGGRIKWDVQRSPDVYYDYHVSSQSPSVDFKKTSNRQSVNRGLRQPQPEIHQALHADYDPDLEHTSKFPRAASPLYFSRTSGRDEAPNSRVETLLHPHTNDLMYDTHDAERVTKSHIPAPSLEKPPGRESPKSPPSHELVYNPNFGQVMPRVHAADLSPKARPTTPQRQTPEPYDYDPQVVTVSSPKNIKLGKMLPRQDIKKQVLDKFYDTPSSLDSLRPHISGNPHMATHLSRDAFNSSHSPKMHKNDKYYDFDLGKTRVKVNAGDADFSRRASRGKPMGAKIAL